MHTYILPLSDPRADLQTVGGKGMSLAKLANARLPVPGGFHITTEAYRQFVGANDLQPKIQAALRMADPALPATLETASATIRSFFSESNIPPAVESAIREAYNTFDNHQSKIVNRKSVAIRSSATAEDLPDASFAGQQETYLNISGADQVLEATKKCWASLWTARAIAYRIRQGTGAEGVALAVVVQLLVDAEAAGIMFTANPLNGNLDEAVINAAWGLGEAVVGGVVTPDTITVSKSKGKVIRRETAEKLVMTVRTESGTEEQPVPHSKKNIPVLSDEQAVVLAKIGAEIEELYGTPMDIEWTWISPSPPGRGVRGEGAFAIVQARPITALPEESAEIPTEWRVPDPKATFARGSLAEHLPSPVSPLFATLGLRIANQETERLWENVMGPDADRLFVKEGFYMPINSYVYGGFRLGPKESWIVTKMTFSQFGPILRGSVERWQTARQIFTDVLAGWERTDLAALPASKLLEAVSTVFRAAVKYYTVVQTTLPAASMSEVIFSRFYNGLVKRKNDPEFTALLFGFETAPVRAEKSLYDIATWLKENPALADYALRTPTGTLVADFRRETPPEGIPAGAWAAWRERFDAHFDRFGRTAYEFDFANPTPAEAPSPQFEAVKLFLEGKGANPYERLKAAVEKREQATRSILERIGWPRRDWFKKLLKWAQEAGAIREDSIADMGLGHPLLRRMFVELGKRFVAGGAIESAEDIYWLKEHEVESLVAALEAGQPLPVFTDQVPPRKAEWRAALQIIPPVILPEKSIWLKLMGGGEAKKRDGKTVLKGLGTSSGQVTAPACVLFGPEDFPKMKPGDVLVATTTTPAWTPLFTLASAVVTDIGGPLSHSSIVAREYGIPAVMAARNATRHIKSGQMVTVDGKAGTVTLENDR